MKKNLVAGQIGCGGFARQWHGHIASKNPHISKIKWACDISGENAGLYAREFNAEKITGSFTDVLTDPEFPEDINSLKFPSCHFSYTVTGKQSVPA